MKTAVLVKLNSAARSIPAIVNYNLQDKKTEGTWPLVNDTFTKKDLVSFFGTSDLPGLTIQQKARLFKRQSKENIRRSMYRNHVLHRNANWSDGHTLVQSLDYHANMMCSPKTAHQISVEWYNSLRQYFWSTYHYRLDNGMAVTHIDDDHTTFTPYNKHQLSQTHLHTHVVILSYNAQGQSIRPYLRKQDIYAFQRLSDGIADSGNFNLRDYYFDKLQKQIKPFSSYTLSRQTNHMSNLERAWNAFKQANDFAYDKDKPINQNKITKSNYQQTVRDRDRYLQMHFGYQVKTTKDSANGKSRQQFTMNIFPKGQNLQQPYYNLINLRLLLWRNRREMKVERELWQFDFNDVLNKPVSNRIYQETLIHAVKSIPSPEDLISPQKRAEASANCKLADVYKQVYSRSKKAKIKGKYDKINLGDDDANEIYQSISLFTQRTSSVFYQHCCQNQFVNDTNRAIDTKYHAQSISSRHSDGSARSLKRPVLNRKQQHESKQQRHINGTGQEL